MRSETRSAHWHSRLFVLLLAATILALFGTFAYTYLAYRDAAAQLVMERDRQVTYLSAARLQSELSKFSDSLVSLARIPGLLGEDPRPREAALAQVSYRLADFDGGVVLLDHFGRVIASQPGNPAVLGQDWSDREVFRLLLGTPRVVFTNGLPEGIEGDQVVTVGVPVLGEGGELAGAVLGMFRLGERTVSSFYASIVRLRIGGIGNTFVVDGAGTILYDDSLTLEGLNFADEVMPGLDLNTEAASVRLRDTRGRDVLASFAPIPGTPWTLVSKADWQSLTSSTRPYANLLLGALAIGMLLPGLGAAVLTRQRNRERLESERRQEDGQVLQGVQQTLLPRSMPVVYGWEVEVHRPSAGPARHLLDDHLLLRDGRMMVSLLRVTEAGLTGAAAMISARAALRAAAQAGLDPAEALRRANNLLCLDSHPDRPVHALFGYLDPDGGQFSFSLAGIDPPLVHPAVSGLAPPAGAGSLGLQPNQEPVTGCLTVPQGGTLVISSGLLDGRDPQGERRGLERLLECLSRAPADPPSRLESLMAELERDGWTAGEEVFVLALSRNPATASREVQRQ